MGKRLKISGTVYANKKHQFSIKVRAAGMLQVELLWNHEEKVFQGHTADRRKLYIDEDVVKEMCRDPQRRKSFSATFGSVR
jgi:hypothetical protein